MELPATATVPTLYFVGVTTGSSSIRTVFPRWAAELGLGNARLAGIDLPVHAPRDEDLFLGLAARIPRIATVEEHVVAGGFGSALSELFHERTAAVELTMLGVPDEFVDHGAQKIWRAHYGLDATGIARAVRSRWPHLVKERAERSAG